MTSQDCPWGPPTTSYCPSWVRRLQSCLHATSLKKEAVQTQILTFHLKSTLCRRAGLQQPEPGAHGAPHRYWAAGGDQADQPGWVHRGRAAAAPGGLLDVKAGWFFLNCLYFTSVTSHLRLPERSSPLQTVPPPEPADFPPGFQLLLPALGPHPAHGLRSVISIPSCIYWNLMMCNPLHISSLTGSADSLLRTYFPDGMSESLIAYLLSGVLKALEYLHRMGYVHRSVRKTKHTNLIICSGDVGNLCLPGPHWLQRGEGQPHSAVRRGPRLPLGAPQCLQYDAWGEEDEGGVRYAPPQSRPAALAQPWAAAAGQELFSTMI